MENSAATEQAKRSKRPIINWAAVGAISGIIGAGIALLGTSVANHWWVFKRPNSLMISSPQNGTIPRCATIIGTMTVPSGYSVWLAQQGSGENKYYNLQQATSQNGGSWQATMTVGTANDVGKVFTIYAFVADSQLSALLNSILTSPAKSFYYLNSLPEGVDERSRNMTRDDHDVAACQ